MLAALFAIAVGVSIAKFSGFEVSPSNVASNASPAIEAEQVYSAVLDDSEFMRDLQSGAVFRRLKRARYERSLREAEREKEEQEENIEPIRGGTYRTVCVRLCDGFYFPISAATTEDRFGRDARACRSKCGSPTRLYVYKNNGGSPDSMRDLRGRAYAALKTAFLYRQTYTKSCTCKAHPWEQEALAQHKKYADAARRKEARRIARLQRRNAGRNARLARRKLKRRPIVRKARVVKIPKIVVARAVAKTDPQPVTKSAAVRKVPSEIKKAAPKRRVRVASYRKRRGLLRLGAKVPRKSSRRPKVVRRKARRSWKSSVLAGAGN